MSRQRSPIGDKTAQSQQGTPRDYRRTMPNMPNNISNNENSSIRQQKMFKSLEESDDTGLCGSAAPAIHLAGEDKSSNRVYKRTVTKLGNTVCHKAQGRHIPDTQRNHSKARGTIIQESVEFGTQGRYTDTSGTISIESVEFGTQGNTIAPGSIRPESVEFGTQGNSNAPGTIRPESVEFGTPGNTTAPDTISPESVEFGIQGNTIETGTISPESVEFGTQGNTYAPVNIGPESVEVGTQDNANAPGTISPESVDFSTQGTHTDTHGTTRPESIDFGARRKHTIPHGPTSTLASVGVGCNGNGTSQHVANASMEFGKQTNHACVKRKTANATEVENTATDVDSRSCNQSSDASASNSQKVTEQSDDSSGEHESLEKKRGVSNSAEDDPGWREFYTCKICFSERIIRHWLLIPCGHVTCFDCMRRVSPICPFCRASFTPQKILYSFE